MGWSRLAWLVLVIWVTPSEADPQGRERDEQTGGRIQGREEELAEQREEREGERQSR